MDDRKSVTLMVGLTYSIVICAVGALIMIIALILPFVAFNPPSLIFKTIWVFISGLFVVIGILGAVFSYQTATLDENGIVFKSIIKTIAKIKWTDIVKVDIQNLVTLHSNIKTHKIKWVVLYTALTQMPKHGGGNSQKPPYQIKYTKKNIEILKKYLGKYCTQCEISDSF